MRTDAEIQQAVMRELGWDTRVKATDVGVEVDSGVVTLTGTVHSYGERYEAQQAAHRVSGVKDVANDIRVHLPSDASRTDTEIAQAVRRALEWDVLVPEERIQSTVSDGVVTLTGTVEFETQAQDAARAVRNLKGVKAVLNNVIVAHPSVAAGTVREEITAALERRAEREAKRLSVEVREGTVTLTGPVHTWMEREAVVGAARFTPGVRSVVDHLRIDPSA